MIEWAMLAALGFLAASLLALMLAPLLWRRAVHLTTLRVRSTLPLSLADIQADKDQLRAQFAMSLRRLEVKLEQVEEKLALQRIETARAEQSVREAQSDVAAKQNLIIEQENELTALKEQLLGSEEESANQLRALGDSNRRLVEATRMHEEELARLHEMNLALDERRVELVALKTRLASADPALGVRIQSLLSQQDDERRMEAQSAAESARLAADQTAAASAVNGAAAARTLAPNTRAADLPPAKSEQKTKEAATPAPLATIEIAKKKVGAGQSVKSETAPRGEQPRKAVSLPVAGKFELKPKAVPEAIAMLSAATPPSPSSAPDAATSERPRATAQQQPAAASPTAPARLGQAGENGSTKPQPKNQPDLEESLHQLQKDLTDPRARAAGGDMRKRLSDMTAWLTKAAIEADGVDGKLARLLKAKGRISEKDEASGPISLARVSSLAAARASTSLMDRIKAFDKVAKN